MNQLMSAAGFDFDEVQLTSIVSPIEYLSFPPVISGTSVGKTGKKKWNYIQAIKLIYDSCFLKNVDYLVFTPVIITTLSFKSL